MEAVKKPEKSLMDPEESKKPEVGEKPEKTLYQSKGEIVGTISILEKFITNIELFNMKCVEILKEKPAFYQLGKAEMKILIESGKKIGKSDENVKNFGSEIVQGVVRTLAGRLVEITTKWNTMSTENNSKILEYNKKLNVFLSEGNMKAAFEELNKYKEELEENLKKTNQLLAEKYKTLDPLKTRLAGEKIYNKGMSTFYKKLVTQTEQKISDLTKGSKILKIRSRRKMMTSTKL